MERDISQASKVLEKIKTDSIINPLLWAGVLIFIIFGSGIFICSGWKAIFCAVVCAFWILLIAGAYILYSIFDRNRLHSEKHQLEVMRLERDASKLKGTIINMEAGSDPTQVQSADDADRHSIEHADGSE